MKNTTVIPKPTLSALVSDRLARLGAASIPPSARDIIEADIIPTVAALIERRVTAPVIGRAVARALVKGAASKADADDRQMSLFPIEEDKV